MEYDVIGTGGKKSGKINLNEKVFNCDVNSAVVYEAIRNENANKHLGTAHTKTSAMVSGSGKKPWRQKGLGRARTSSYRSIQWVGGGRAWGGQHKNYKYNVPAKVKRESLRSLISFKLKNNKLKIIDNISLEKGKTKELLKFLAGIFDCKDALIVMPNDDPKVKRAARNIPNLECENAKRLSSNIINRNEQLLICKDAVNILESWLG